MAVTLHLTDAEEDVLVIEGTNLYEVIDAVEVILGDRDKAEAYLKGYFAEENQ